MTQQNGAAPAKGRPKRRRRLRRALLWTLSIVVVLAVVASGFGVWSVTRAFPQTSGRIEVAGLDADVTVQRDEHGIPTITAQSTGDLFFAQGFVHAQDRFWEMDFRRHLTSARLSELFGESQLGTDTFLRTLGWHRVAEQEVAALPREVLGYYEAYAAGVNAYLAEREGGALSLEYTVLGLQNPGYEPEPWTPADSVAWLKAMAWDLRTNIEDETARAREARYLDASQLAELYPGYPFDEHPVILADDPAGEAVVAAARSGSGATASGSGSTGAATAEGVDLAPLNDLLDRADALVAPQGEGVGSNSWVVSGEHTESGEPLLANDPHLGAALPSVWTQMQLRCAEVTEQCPFDVAGFSFSGLPGIVIGHNQRVAWGFTNLTTDVADLYVERVDPDGYWQDGVKHPFETREETIRVAGGRDVRIEVRSTGHGPIVSGLTSDFTEIADDPRVGLASGTAERAVDPSTGEKLPGTDYALSLRWTALDVTRSAEAIFTLNLADGFTDFRAAASQFDVPAQNLIYADVDGNIGYQAPGRLPIRGLGDGWLPQPGWDSAYNWQGFIPFDDQPWTLNPEAGYIVTANNAIVDDDYPYFLSRDWDYGYRAARIDELLRQRMTDGPLTAADMAEIQMDAEMPAAKSLQRAYAGVRVDDEGTRDALDLLARWDGQADADSAAAAYANVLWEHVTALMTGNAGGEVFRDDQSRFAVFFEQRLADPGSRWWTNAKAGVSSRDELLRLAAEQAYEELSELQGADPARWNWGKLHALPLRNGTFGESGIAPIEALFNRGPFPVSGGSGVVNATGWTLGGGYATVTVPSMRMVIDVSDWDASTWQNLTGQSGHAFDRHYVDQTTGWSRGEQYRWTYSPAVVGAATEDALTLVASG